ncbi:ABC transporter substrate-binding protein [Streptomyces sp. NPDC004788]
MNNAKIGTALIGGYVLGRTKKAKLALGLAMALAGSRIKPGQLKKSIATSPFLSNVNQQVRGELMSVGKTAATTVLNAKAEHLADALHRRTEGLRGEEHEDEGDGREADEVDEVDEHEPPDDGAGHDEQPEEDATERAGRDEETRDEEGGPSDADEEPEPRPRRTTASRRTASAGRTGRTAETAKQPAQKASGASKGTRTRSTRRRDDA